MYLTFTSSSSSESTQVLLELAEPLELENLLSGVSRVADPNNTSLKFTPSKKSYYFIQSIPPAVFPSLSSGSFLRRPLMIALAEALNHLGNFTSFFYMFLKI